MKKVNVLVAVVVICFVFSGFAVAQNNIGFNGVGAFVGFAMPDNIDNTLAFGAKADLGTIMDGKVAIEGDLSFWKKSEDEGTWEFSYSQLTIGALGKYFLNPMNSMKPYVGGGVGLTIATAKAEYSGTANQYVNDWDESDTELGITLMGGVNFDLSDTLTGFAEARYQLGGTDTFMIVAGAMFPIG